MIRRDIPRHDTPRDQVLRRERCTDEERRRELEASGRPALGWIWYADGSLGCVLGQKERE